MQQIKNMSFYWDLLNLLPAYLDVSLGPRLRICSFLQAFSQSVVKSKAQKLQIFICDLSDPWKFRFQP